MDFFLVCLLLSGEVFLQLAKLVAVLLFGFLGFLMSQLFPLGYQHYLTFLTCHFAINALELLSIHHVGTHVVNLVFELFVTGHQDCDLFQSFFILAADGGIVRLSAFPQP